MIIVIGVVGNFGVRATAELVSAVGAAINGGGLSVDWTEGSEAYFLMGGLLFTVVAFVNGSNNYIMVSDNRCTKARVMRARENFASWSNQIEHRGFIGDA